jgi:2-keto-4-pentenoate hydratase/2-oxohepta-3-ene-1,7-dioic acid hydratase in catechol pathway
MSYVTIRKTGERLPVSKILCVGANYADHIAEMNPGKIVVKPAEPVIFMKPPSAIVHNGGSILVPRASNEVHHEVELVVVIGQEGKFLTQDRALDHVLGFAVGVDLTLRDLQAAAKQAGRPWTIAKGFDTSALISDAVLTEETPGPNSFELKLSVNGIVRQRGTTAGMLFGIAEILVYLSSFFTLLRGDLIFTGTPAGAGPLKEGDRVKAELVNWAVVEGVVGRASG